MKLEETLNYQIATKVLGWTVKPQGHAIVQGCYDKSGNYQGLLGSFEWTYELGCAFALLKDQEWKVGTCDFGYVCGIYEAPEKGGALLGEGIDDTIPLAICKAAVNAADKK